MFQVSVQVDDKYLQARMPAEIKRCVFNVAQALNNTMLTIQAETVAQVKRDFIIRKESSGRTGAWITDQIVFNAAGRAQARTGKLYADLKIGGKDRVLLPMFETEGIRKPFVGKANIAEPVSTGVRAGGSWAGMVRPELQYSKLGLKLIAPRGFAGAVFGGQRYNVHKASGFVKLGTGKEFKGKLGTFTLHSAKFPNGAVFQRTGKGKSEFKLLYVNDPPYKLKHTLHVFDIAARVAGERFAIELKLAYAGRPLGTEI